MNHPSKVDTEPFPLPGQDADVQRPEPYSSLVTVDLFGKSDPGKVRPRNEDHFLIARSDRALKVIQSNLPDGDLPERFDEVGYGYLVADGMGGHAGGATASRMAINTLVNLGLNVPDWILRAEPGQIGRLMDRAKERYSKVDEVLRKEAAENPRLYGMGTTMTLVYSLGADLVLAHVGDSRAYLYRGGTLHQLTQDQTLAQALADRGLIRQDEVATHRLRHVLTGVLGGTEDGVPVQVRRLWLEDGDRVLLCSDGLTEMVKDAAIAGVLGRVRGSEAACDALVRQALDNGGRDNVTVLVAGYRLPGSAG